MAPTWTYAWIIAGMHDMGLNAQQADIVVAAAVEIEEESQGSAKTCIYAATTAVAWTPSENLRAKKIIFRNLRG